MSTTLHLLDVVIVAAYLAALAVVGVYFSRRQTDLNEFFRARQTMTWLHSPIGFMWPSTFGLAATLAVGWMLALLSPARPSAAALQLTWKAVVGVDTVSV